MPSQQNISLKTDDRERKGAFYTPKIWVEKSQEYLAKAFGENWQDEYYIWDCAAGTGNLLTGLTNKYHIWASTLDKADVDVMHDRIENGANLLKDHAFQFDFLNDDFSKLPKGLRNIINDENKCKKLIIYINPPYAEGGNYTGRTKSGVATNYAVNQELKLLIGTATNELFSLFFAHARQAIPVAHLAAFASVKYISAYNFCKYRRFFKADYRDGFICLSKTFDNVCGEFPIGFLIWSFSSTNDFPQAIQTDIFDPKGQMIGRKDFYNGLQYINEWMDSVKPVNGEHPIGFLSCKLNEFQYNQYVCLCNTKEQLPYGSKSVAVTVDTLIESCIYLAVRHSIGLTIPHKEKWIRHNDPFLLPDKRYRQNIKFLNDCLVFALFHEKNKITSQASINHWIPFTESEVNARSKFESNFMADFISGKIQPMGNLLSDGHTKTNKALVFSSEAKAVFKAGKELWTYYHSQKKANVNASLYDIREHFQGRNDKGRMNAKSNDETYNALVADLRSALKALAAKIEPKVYEYGFLKK